MKDLIPRLRETGEKQREKVPGGMAVLRRKPLSGEESPATEAGGMAVLRGQPLSCA
ncbi:hypothetical protein HanHA300_Chr12g0455331 [Helianthus annuus]|nr:hypothetical protein HanHA300_Chr12g0455331 [Helianthus annuus]KAJ0676021.1 hypothetical protein HanLR1_Chr12g0457881 [Helianthus annuus]